MNFLNHFFPDILVLSSRNLVVFVVVVFSYNFYVAVIWAMPTQLLS